MSEADKKMEESWDPDEAREKIGSLKSPVEFKFGNKAEDVKIEFIPQETKQEDKIAKPKIVDTKKKNKGSLF